MSVIDKFFNIFHYPRESRVDETRLTKHTLIRFSEAGLGAFDLVFGVSLFLKIFSFLPSAFAREVSQFSKLGEVGGGGGGGEGISFLLVSVVWIEVI